MSGSGEGRLETEGWYKYLLSGENEHKGKWASDQETPRLFHLGWEEWVL